MTRLGITGHQRLEDPAAWPWVEEVVGRELDAAAAPLVVVTSLAVGADQLAARLGIARSAPDVWHGPGRLSGGRPARCGVVGRTNCSLGRKSRQGKRWNR